MVVSATEIQNNFGKYLKLSEYEDVIITRNGKKIASLVSCRQDGEHCIINESTPEYIHAGIKITYENFLKIAEESEKRYEYIDGEIFILASPSYPHQKAIGSIFSQFSAWLDNKKCMPVLSPFDVTLHKSKSNICVVQPDLLVICDSENINEKGRYNGIPALVVEVLSDSTSSKDHIKKLDLYMQSGVQEYWIVNTANREVYIYAFEENAMKSIRSYKNIEKAESICFQGLVVELEKVFA